MAMVAVSLMKACELFSAQASLGYLCLQDPALHTVYWNRTLSDLILKHKQVLLVKSGAGASSFAFLCHNVGFSSITYSPLLSLLLLP